MDPGLRRALLAILAEERAPAGAVLLEQGQPNDHLSFLIEGIDRDRADLPRGDEGDRGHAVSPGRLRDDVVLPADVAERLGPRHGRRLVLDAVPPRARAAPPRDPRAAEALALAAVRVLAERFDVLDKRVSDYLAGHDDDPPKATEWANFRAGCSRSRTSEWLGLRRPTSRGIGGVARGISDSCVGS